MEDQEFRPTREDRARGNRCLQMKGILPSYHILPPVPAILCIYIARHAYLRRLTG